MTRSKPFASVVADAESASMTKVLASQTELITAKVLHPETLRAMAEAEDNLLAVRRAIKRLEEATPDDLLAAEVGVRHGELREAGARRRLGDARTQVRYAAVDIAEAVASVLRESHSAPVVATFATVREAPRDADLPVMLVRQDGPTKHHDNGSISGVVEVLLYRNDDYRELSRERISTALANHGIAGEVSFISSPSAGVDRVRVTVHAAAPTVPLIPAISGLHRDLLGRTLAYRVAEAVRFYDEGVERDHVSGCAAVKRLTVVPVDTESDEKLEDGIRTLTVTSTLAARLDKALPDYPNGVFDVLTEQCAALEGVFLPGLGVVQEIAFVAVDDESASDRATTTLRRATGGKTDAGMVGFEAVSAWTVRAVLVSAYVAPEEEAA